MARSAMTPAVTLASLTWLLAACTADPGRAAAPARRFTLLEHVQVTGACVPESGGPAARYTGFVERWHDAQKQRDLLHGSVSNFDRFIDPGRPGDRPPPSIQFGETDATPLSADRLVLKGLSGGSPPSPATCTLDVTSREQPARHPGRLLAGVLDPRSAVGGAALLVGLVAGIRLIRHQVRRTSAPWLLGLALLLQLVALLL
jgi:hypothetical protein